MKDSKEINEILQDHEKRIRALEAPVSLAKKGGGGSWDNRQQGI